MVLSTLPNFIQPIRTPKTSIILFIVFGLGLPRGYGRNSIATATVKFA